MASAAPTPPASVSTPLPKVLRDHERDTAFLGRAFALVGDVRLVRTEAQLRDALAAIFASGPPEALAVDAEAETMFRFGTRGLGTLQLRASEADTTYILQLAPLASSIDDARTLWDVHPANRAGDTLRALLTTSATQKIFHDVRGDADVLTNRHDIVLANVFDTQAADGVVSVLRERQSTGKVVREGRSRSYKDIVAHYDCLRPSQAAVFQQLEEFGKALHSTPRGCTLWHMDDPLPRTMQLYAAVDVVFLDAVQDALCTALSKLDTGKFYAEAVDKESARRVGLSCSGSAGMTRAQMQVHPQLVHLVNPCSRTRVPDVPLISDAAARSRTQHAPRFLTRGVHTPTTTPTRNPPTAVATTTPPSVHDRAHDRVHDAPRRMDPFWGMPNAFVAHAGLGAGFLPPKPPPHTAGWFAPTTLLPRPLS